MRTGTGVGEPLLSPRREVLRERIARGRQRIRLDGHRNDAEALELQLLSTNQTNERRIESVQFRRDCAGKEQLIFDWKRQALRTHSPRIRPGHFGCFRCQPKK